MQKVNQLFSTLHCAKIVVIITTIVAVLATYHSIQTESILAYNDATAHLNTARRIIDNLTPGLVQIGSVWLPLLHLLEIPFVANFHLWQTGIAGAIVSGGSFVVSSWFLYKLLFQITNRKLPSLIGVLAFIANINLLYLQSMAMFEPLLMATAFGAIYYLSLWSKDNSVRSLVFAAFFTMLASLTRYDGWALFLACSAYVLLISFLQKHKSISGSVTMFSTLAGFGIILWFVYNLAIFGDPFFFSSGEFSAKAQQDILFERGQLPTKGDLELSFVTYTLAVLINNGVVITVVSLLGVLIFLFNNAFKTKRWAPLILLVPYAFNILTLYLGQSVIWLPMIEPFFETYFNARYGLLMLPAIAFFVGYLAYKHLLAAILVVAAIIVQVYLFANPHILPIAGEEIGAVVLQDTVSSVNDQTRSSSKFLNENHDGGLVLVSSASADAFIFRAGLPLKNFITEGTGDYWRESLEDPSRHASWIVFFNDESDRVGRKVAKSKVLKQKYERVYQDATYQIWKIK